MASVALAAALLVGLAVNAYAEPKIDVTVENVDPSGQWLYSDGLVQVQGAASSKGLKPSPVTVSFAPGNGIRVLGVLGDGTTSTYQMADFAGYFIVNDGDRITVNALTLEWTISSNQEPAGTAKVQIAFPVVGITVEAVDRAGASVPAQLQVQGGVTSGGLQASPLSVTMVDSVGYGVRVRGVLGDRDTGYTDYFIVNDGDRVTVDAGVPTVIGGLEPSRKARIQVKFDVTAPVLAQVGDLSLPEGQSLVVPVSAADADGTSPQLSVVNLPPFASFADNGDGTGTLSLAPGFADAGVYADVTVVATDAVDPLLQDAETITLTVTEAEPLAVTVENWDPTEQWLYDYGFVQVQGAATTDGLKASPQTVSFATGKDIRVLGRLGTGDEDFSFYQTADFSAYVTVDDGDRIVIDALTLAVDEQTGVEPPGTARVRISYPVIKIRVETIDGSGTSIPAQVQLRDGVTTKGLRAAPFDVTMVDGAGKVVDVRGVLGDRDLGFVDDVPVVGRDLVTVKAGAYTTQAGAEPANTARIAVGFPVTVPMLADVGDRSVPEGQTLAVTISATDADGTSPRLSALNLPPFATFADNGDGTATLALAPSFEQAGVYPNVTIVATDAVDPLLKDTETITLTVTDAEPLSVTVENWDPTGQWLYDYGFVQVQGAATTEGSKPSPQTVSFASGKTIRVLGQLGPGDEDSSFYNTIFSEYFTVDDGERVVIDALTMAVDEQAGVEPAGTARVRIAYPVIKITVETVDRSGNPIPGGVQLQDGVTTKGVRPAPLAATMVDGAGKVLNVRGILGDRDLGYVDDVPITSGDLVTIQDGAYTTQSGVEPAHTARISLGFPVAVPALEPVGSQTVAEGQVLAVTVTATDADGTTPELTALDLPGFASFSDNGDGTGVLTLAPSFEEAGTYENVTIVATDAVDPDLKALEAITVTVTDAVPLTVVVENADPTGQWLYQYGLVQVQGAATTSGLKTSPQTVQFASGNGIRVRGQLGPGDEEDSCYKTGFSEYMTVDEGDLFLVHALTMAVEERPGAEPAGEARVQIVYPVLKITVETVDSDGNAIPGEIQLRDGVTTKDLKPAPVVVTMVDSVGKKLDLRAVLNGRDTGFIQDIPITDGDRVTIQGDTFATQTGVEPARTARITVPANRPPVAVAAVDGLVDGKLEATAPATQVTLVGSGSSDPDEGDVLQYRWALYEGDASLQGPVLYKPTSLQASSDATLPAAPATGYALGTYTAVLLVSDGQAEATDAVTFEVVDTTPPQLLKLSSLDGDDVETVLWSPEVQQDLVIECTGADGETVRFLASAEEAVDTDPAYLWSVRTPASTDFVEMPGDDAALEHTFAGLGTFTVKVAVRDASGNVGEAVEVDVVLQDTAAPVLTLAGPNPMALELGTSYAEPGATAMDACAGDLTDAIEVVGTVDSNTEGTYPVTYTVADPSGNVSTAVRQVNVVVTSNSYVFLATNSIHLRNKSTVGSGFVGTNGQGEKPWLSGHYELRIGDDAETMEGVRLSAPDVRVDNKVEIRGTLVYETLKEKKKAEIANEVTVGPEHWPLVESLPPFLTGAPGDEDVRVRSKQSETLEAGAYGDVKVDGKATLVLAGGTYYFRSFTAKSRSTVRAAAPSTLVIERGFRTQSDAYFGPAEGTSVDASDILIYVRGVKKYASEDDGGKKGPKGKRDDDDEAEDEEEEEEEGAVLDGANYLRTPVRIGSKSVFRANVYAPFGTVRLEQRSRSIGSFIGRDIQLDERAVVSLQSGWNVEGVIYSAPTVPQAFAAKLAPAEEAHEAEAPADVVFGVDQNYPNPFNPVTTIRYGLPEGADVRLAVYNVLGQEVRVLVNQHLPAGAHTARWDGRDASGRGVSSGIYLYRLVAGDRVAVRKMIFAK